MQLPQHPQTTFFASGWIVPFCAAPGALLHHPLDRFKRFSLNDRFMGIFYNDPLRFWKPNRLFRLVTYLFMLSLHHISDIKLIMQYLIDGGTAPKSLHLYSLNAMR